MKLEKSLSGNSIEGYLDDVHKLKHFCEEKKTGPLQVDYALLKLFIIWVNEQGLAARSQARIISGIKSFYKYLILENEQVHRVYSSPKQLKIPYHNL